MTRLLLLVIGLPLLAPAYPLDADQRTGIRRLTGYRLAQSGKVRGPKVPLGGQWPESRIELHLRGNATFDLTAQTPKDPFLQQGLEKIVGRLNTSYGLALLDITAPAAPLYAAVRETDLLLPGSVGKLLVATGMFQALRTVLPQVPDRERLLRETVRTADAVVHTDGKTVPFYQDGWPGVVSRKIATGDRFSLWEWLDHMLSQSSNAAGSFTWKEALLLRRFGVQYPPAPDAEKQFFDETPKGQLAHDALETLEEPLRQANLDTAALRLGTLFTSGGSRLIPGTRSFASPRELLRWLVRLEQGRLVDEWSSLEIKKLIYFSRPRYRYASAPALTHHAVFFKSGSFFQCRPEAGFTCKQYAGNETNIMNSVAIVESADRVYLVTLMSNVLKINSAAEHQRIAGLVDALVRSRPPKP